MFIKCEQSRETLLGSRMIADPDMCCDYDRDYRSNVIRPMRAAPLGGMSFGDESLIRNTRGIGRSLAVEPRVCIMFDMCHTVVEIICVTLFPRVSD